MPAAGFDMDELWKFSFKSKKWQLLQCASDTHPGARYLHTSVLVGSSMLVYGGNGAHLGDVWSYDLQTSVWQRLTESTAGGAALGPGDLLAHTAVAAADSRLATSRALLQNTTSPCTVLLISLHTSKPLNPLLWKKEWTGFSLMCPSIYTAQGLLLCIYNGGVPIELLLPACCNSGFHVYGGRHFDASHGEMNGDVWFYGLEQRQWQKLPSLEESNRPRPLIYHAMTALSTGDTRETYAVISAGKPPLASRHIGADEGCCHKLHCATFHNEYPD